MATEVYFCVSVNFDDFISPTTNTRGTPISHTGLFGPGTVDLTVMGVPDECTVQLVWTQAKLGPLTPGQQDDFLADHKAKVLSDFQAEHGGPPPHPMEHHLMKMQLP